MNELHYILAGPLIVPFILDVAWGIGVAYAAYYVASLFNKASDANFEMPKMSNYPIQTAARGVPIAKVYGTDRVAGNVIYAHSPSSYSIHHKDEGYYEIRYRRSFLIGVCEGPARILRMWKGKEEIAATEGEGESDFPNIMIGGKGGTSGGTSDTRKVPWSITIFEGIDNLGIKDLTEQAYGEYPKLCCVFFENYELGHQQAIPNFTFEVSSDVGVTGKTLIYDLAGLQAMNNDLTGDYALMTDLDASGTVSWNAGEGFVPIGGSGDEFKGTLDGRNHTIDSLYINRTTSYIGLFGYLGDVTVAAQNAHISNLKLTNSDISGNGVIGIMSGAVGAASTVTDCYVEGTVYTTGHQNGSLVGLANNGAVITRCAAVGSVTIYPTNDRSHTGGLIGTTGTDVNLIDCYARVIVAGGVTGGVNTGSLIGNEGVNNVLTNCYAAGSIQYSNSEYTYNYDTRPVIYQGGGIIGLWAAGGTYTSCYWDTEEGSSVYPDAAKFASGYKHERQSHDISADPTAGHFHITHNAITTGEIAWDANEATVQAACDAAFGAGEFDIEFTTGDKWDSVRLLKVMFKGAVYGQSPQADLTFDFTALVPGGLTVISADDVTGVAPLSDANITGKTTAQMGVEATFIGWDFDAVWYMADSEYPELRSHLLSGYDMNPADIIEDIIENDRYGVGDTTIIDDTSLAACRAYWAAENMLLSITLDQTKPWIDWVDYILSHVSGARFFSGGKLHLGVLQDEAAVATIAEDNLVREDTENPPPPVSVTKRPRSDTFNRLEVGWVDRNNKYELDFVVVQDRVDQRLNGVRKKVIRLEGIRSQELAIRIAYRLLIDGLYRFNIYNFNVSFSNSLLENFDVISLSDGEKLSSERVRIMTIAEAVNGRGMSITAMDDLAIHYPNLSDYDIQENEYAEDPGITLADVTVNFREDIAAANIYLSCTPGNDSFNGGYVYRSYDDISYDLVGRFGVDGVTGGDSNSVGTITGFIPAHPAVTWAKDETLLVSIGTVTDLRTDVTDDEYWNNRYLAKIGDEIIAFKDAEETATAGIWQISNLRRGLFGTDPVAHYASETFCTLRDDYEYNYAPGDIGSTLYFKVIANYATDVQPLAAVTAVSITVQGYYVRPAAASLLRLTADENDGGEVSYSGASFALYWNLGSRTSGYGVGGIDVNPADISWFYPDAETLLINSGGVLYDNYIQDTELQAVVLKFEQEDGTAIGEREIAVGETATITKATDLGGFNPAIIKVIPRRAMYAWDENSITVDDGT